MLRFQPFWPVGYPDQTTAHRFGRSLESSPNWKLSGLARALILSSSDFFSAAFFVFRFLFGIILLGLLLLLVRLLPVDVGEGLSFEAGSLSLAVHPFLHCQVYICFCRQSL